MISVNPTYRNTAARFPLIDQSLRGLSQIMLQDNPLTGLLLLVGVFIGSTSMGIAFVISVFAATLTAHLFKYKIENINKGLYGFNAALVGVAILLFNPPSVSIWCTVVFGAILSTVVQHFFIKHKISVFTLPFVLVTWVLLFLLTFFSSELISIASPVIPNNQIDFNFVFRSYGQVIFQDNLLVGILFFIAVLISAPLAALYGLLVSVIAVVVAYLLSAPIESINLGLASYNAVLCALVFAGSKRKDAIWVLVSVILATLLGQLMTTLPFAQLTFPFLAASFMTLILKNNIRTSGEK